MPYMPFQILGLWFRALLSIALVAIGIFLVKEWSDRRAGAAPSVISSTRPVSDRTGNAATDESESSRAAERPQAVESPSPSVRPSDWEFGFNRATCCLAGGILLIAWSVGGGWLMSSVFRPRDSDPPQAISDGTIERLRRPDGTELYVESFGPPDGIPLILVHGWGLDSQEWIYARKELAGRCRLIVWDLPGLGQSKGPANKDWSLEKLAHDLDAVLALAGNRPAILAGHSIGGMIILTFCRIFPDALDSRVSALVLAQSTYTNPVYTTSMAALHRALQKPVLEPLCHLMIWLAPLVWVFNWLSYLNGSAHRSNHRSFFSGNESREQLGFIARYSVTAWPAVIARGLLAMFRYDATPTLAAISVPTLIVDGERDTTCTPEASARMHESISKSERTTLRGARHGGVFEMHQPFAAAIHRMISDFPAVPHEMTGGPHAPGSSASRVASEKTSR